MINQTFKFYGLAYADSGSASVTAVFNGVQIHSGPVVTRNNTEEPIRSTPLVVLFEYTCPIDITGQIPLILSVTSGRLVFGDVYANYRGSQFELDTSDPALPFVRVIISPENFYRPVSNVTAESDGKNNVVINGVAHSRNLDAYPELFGAWRWPISESETFSCDIFVDPAVIATTMPTAEKLVARRNQLAADSE